MSPRDQINKISEYINAKGFKYDENLLANFYLSLKAKPFVLLAGTSGTGKTRLVRLFAEAIGAYGDGRYKQVAVKPDWSDSTDRDVPGKITPSLMFTAGPRMTLTPSA